MMKILLKNGRIIDPKTKKNAVLDLLIERSRIKSIGRNITDKNAQVINLRGKIIAPGLIDAHVHLREPGFEHKETIKTGSYAAAVGGFTTVIMEPNTLPAIDTPARVKKIIHIAKKDSVVNIYTKASITKGLRGERATDVRALKKAGAVAISDDGNPVASSKIMENAFIKSKLFNIEVSPHCEESQFYRDNVKSKLKKRYQPHLLINAAKFFKEPYSSEADFIKRDLDLAHKTGAKLHISHVSLAQSVKLIAAAKNKGVKVTAEAAPHHFLLTANDAKKIGTNAKVNPPLRTKNDLKAIREGIINGTLDIIASDHAPHSHKEKALPWFSSKGKKEAPFGMVGLESSLALVLTYLVKPGFLTMTQAIEKMTLLPSKIFGLKMGTLELGASADITVIDPKKKWTIDSSKFHSKGKNSPFDGWSVQGKAVMTIVNGRIVMQDGKIIV